MVKMVLKKLRNLPIYKICVGVTSLIFLSSCTTLKPIFPDFRENSHSLKTFTKIPKPLEIRIKDLTNRDAKILKKEPIREQNTQTESSKNNLRTAPLSNKIAVQDEKLVWPVKGKIEISFSEQVQQKKTLPGIHILTYKNCPVKAAASGVVSHSGSYGMMNFIIVTSYPDTKIAYGYLTSAMPKIGERVSAGQTIGHVLGKNNKPVLYLAVKKNNVMVDPLKYLP